MLLVRLPSPACWACALSRSALEGAQSLDKALGHKNKGFQLLKKLGWKEDRGLGKEGKGRMEPVELSQKSGIGGLGRETLVEEMTRPENFQRKKLEVEIELTEERKEKL